MVPVGIVSPGAMGSAIGRILMSGGTRAVVDGRRRSARTRKLAEGLALLPTIDDVVGRVGDRALRRTARCGSRRSGGDRRCRGPHRRSATRRGSERRLADHDATVVASASLERGLHLVDGSISGPPPRVAGTTVIYLSGPRAAQVASLDTPGLELRVVGDTIGTASAIKMSTASFYKGQTAILAQALRAALTRTACCEFVLDDLGRHYPDLVDDAPRMLQSIAAKSGRYVAEMEEIAATQQAAGLPPELFAALAKVFGELSRTEAATRAPEEADAGATLDEVLASLDAHGANGAVGVRGVGGVTRRSR